MEVGHRLPSLLTTVNHQPIATLGNAMLPRQLIGNPGHMPDKRELSLSQLSHGRDMLSGDDKQVRGRGRIDIMEGYYLLILIQELTQSCRKCSP